MAEKKLFGLDAPPARKKLTIEVKVELVEELERLTQFVREEEGPHIEQGHVLEYILEKAYFGSSRLEVREFKKWKEQDAAGEEEAGKSSGGSQEKKDAESDEGKRGGGAMKENGPVEAKPESVKEDRRTNQAPVRTVATSRTVER